MRDRSLEGNPDIAPQESIFLSPYLNSYVSKTTQPAEKCSKKTDYLVKEQGCQAHFKACLTCYGVVHS